MAAGPIKRVAFLGLGIMGAPQAANVARGGFDLTVWNRTRSKAEALAAEVDGITLADSPAEAADGADAVITMVTDGPQVEEVLFGNSGAADALSAGATVIDMSTIPPSVSTGIAERLGAKNVGFADAPVTGSRPKALDGTLTIMVGAGDDDFQRITPLLESMGEIIIHCGPVGHGELIKLINNTVAAINTSALAEAFVMGERAGVDKDALVAVLKAGTGGSTMLERKGQALLDRDYEPLFRLEHMLKDVRHCIREAEALGVDLPFARLTESFYAKAAESGLGAKDFVGVIDAIETASVAR
jgi:3-hydroxyisobutyrate dehydrogenase-like beta-hydroxyacid dehydrogenase